MQDEFREIKKQLKKTKKPLQTSRMWAWDRAYLKSWNNVQRVDHAFHLVVCDCKPTPPHAF